MTDTLQYTLVDHIATITFNRPDAMNTFDIAMAHELKALTKHIQQDASVRAVLLKGSGNTFMAGGDIHFFHKHLDTDPEAVIEMVRTLNTSINHLMEMPNPVVASVHGSVAGVGMSFMMACDLVIAAEDTKFTMAYSGIGITPDGGSSYHLPRILGTKKAMELMLLSGVFDAQTAQAHGLVNWVVAPEILKEETQHLMQRLANGPTQSYAHIKKLMHQSWQNNLENQLELEANTFATVYATDDFKTGVRSFIQKKKPKFAGK